MRQCRCSSTWDDLVVWNRYCVSRSQKLIVSWLIRPLASNVNGSQMDDGPSTIARRRCRGVIHLRKNKPCHLFLSMRWPHWINTGRTWVSVCVTLSTAVIATNIREMRPLLIQHQIECGFSFISFGSSIARFYCCWLRKPKHITQNSF